MGSRLHTTLVYFGVVRDEQEEARLDADRINAWRALAVAVACVLVLVIVVGALVLLRASGVDPFFIGLFSVFEVAVIVTLLSRR